MPPTTADTVAQIIINTAHALRVKLCLAQSKYIHAHRVEKDLCDVLERMYHALLRFEAEDEDEIYEFATYYVSEVQDILLVLRPEYVDEGSRKLDRRVNEHDLAVTDALVAFCHACE